MKIRVLLTFVSYLDLNLDLVYLNLDLGLDLDVDIAQTWETPQLLQGLSVNLDLGLVLGLDLGLDLDLVLIGYSINISGVRLAFYVWYSVHLGAPRT